MKDWTVFYRVRTGTDNSVTDCNLRKGSAVDSHQLLIQSNLDMQYYIKAPELQRRKQDALTKSKNIRI